MLMVTFLDFVFGFPVFIGKQEMENNMENGKLKNMKAVCFLGVS